MTHKKKKIALATIFILLLGGYLGIKYSVPYFLAPKIKELAKKELNAEINIEDISFEPFGLILQIKNLNLAKSNYLEKLYINFSIPDLKNKKIDIPKISLVGLNIKVSDLNNNFIKRKVDAQKIDASKYGNLKISLDSNQQRWQINVQKIEILESKILTEIPKPNPSLDLEKNLEPENYYVVIKELEIEDLIIAKEISLQLKAHLKFNQSRIYLNGKISNSNNSTKGEIAFKMDDFNLKFLNMIHDVGSFEGKASAEGTLKFNGADFDSRMDLQINRFFANSKDLKTINYFAKEIDLEDLKISRDSSFLNFKSGSVVVQNLLLSKPSDQFDESKLSIFSKIKIDNIKINHGLKNLQSIGEVNFSDGGNINFDNRELAMVSKEDPNKKLAKELNLKINNLDLTKFSEALQTTLNYQISSGKLDLDIKIKTENKKIKGKVKILLTHLELDKKNEFGENLENDSSIPLKTALFIITDKHGNINLKFNVYGDKNDLSFNSLNIFGKSLASLIISKAGSIITTTLSTEFAPAILSSIPTSPADLLSLASGAYRTIAKPRFKDLEFAPLTDQLTEDSKIRLEDFSKFLVDHEKLKFKICPIVSLFESEQKNTKEKIDQKTALLLANQRIDVLKDFFKKRMENGLEQIIFCRPAISNTRRNISEAEISI
ncbi:MAG: hypothetical protein ACI9TO_000050 [Rickettsiales bacterium]|jgi:hypothetical protein